MGSQSKTIYGAFQALKDDKAAFAQLTASQKRLVERELMDFRLGGVSLEGKAHDEFNAISQRLADLSTKYSDNVLDSTKKWTKLVTSKDAVKGVPETALKLAAAAARKEGHAASSSDDPSGPPYLIALDGPAVGPILTYAEDRDLRKELYIAHTEIASDLSGPDNGPVLEEILKLRQRKAELLGFKNYAVLSMQQKMATPEKADSLLEELRSKSHPLAKQDRKDLQACAGRRVG